MNTTVTSRQSIFDIALQNCGSVEAAFKIAFLNELSLTDELNPGQQLKLPSVVNSSVVQYYNVNKLHPATELSDEQDPTGIGYWLIEKDFIVQ